MKKTGLKEVVKVFSFDYNAIKNNDTLDISRYLIKEKRYKTMFGFIDKFFLRLSSICTMEIFSLSLTCNYKKYIECTSLN